MAQWVRYGPHAVLLRFAETPGEDALARRFAIVAELEGNPPAGLVEYVPGFTTLLLRFESWQAEHLSRIGHDMVERVSRLPVDQLPEPAIKHIPVVYNGEDLESLASAKGLSIDDVVRLHSEPIYHVHLLGFSPGFPYLGELNPALHTPRRATPRPRVAAGSVAIGGEHTGIYSVDSPGGWHIIGRTPVTLFDHRRVDVDTHPQDVFFLWPGDRVRFIPVTLAEDRA